MRLETLLRQGAVLALWLAVWAAAATLVGHTLLLPSPAETARALWTLVRQGDFWRGALASVGRIFAGFAAGLCLGALLAALSARFAFCRAFFAPMLSVIKATPVASFIVLALVWLRTNGVPVFATVLVVLPVACANVSAGLAAMDRDLLEMARAFGLSRRAQAVRVVVPALSPYLRAAVTAGMGMAWKAGVAAEVLCLPANALGTTLYEAKIYLDTPALFAGTAVVIALSILLEKAVVRMAYGKEGGGRARVGSARGEPTAGR